MTMVVESSADQVASLEKGEIIQPADVIADNAKRNGEPVADVGLAEPSTTEGSESAAPADKEAEDANGLTAEQRAELTDKMQKAIGKKHRALKEAEEFAADQYNQRRLAEQRAEQFERESRRLQAQLNGNAEPVTEEGAKPKREAYETQEAYDDAVIDWKVDQRLKAQESAQQKQAQEDRQREMIAAAQAHVTKAQELVPDYAEVLGAADQIVPPHIASYMAESDMIAELGYHFAKHPEELQRLSGLSIAKALVDVGKIESKLTPFAKPQADAKDTKDAIPASTNGSKPSTETGSAPSKPRAAAPIKPLGSGTAQVEKDVSDMNVREVINDWSKKRAPAMMRRQRH